MTPLKDRSEEYRLSFKELQTKKQLYLKLRDIYGDWLSALPCEDPANQRANAKRWEQIEDAAIQDLSSDLAVRGNPRFTFNITAGTATTAVYGSITDKVQSNSRADNDSATDSRANGRNPHHHGQGPPRANHTGSGAYYRAEASPGARDRSCAMEAPRGMPAKRAGHGQHWQDARKGANAVRGASPGFATPIRHGHKHQGHNRSVPYPAQAARRSHSSPPSVGPRDGLSKPADWPPGLSERRVNARNGSGAPSESSLDSVPTAVTVTRGPPSPGGSYRLPGPSTPAASTQGSVSAGTESEREQAQGERAANRLTRESINSVSYEAFEAMAADSPKSGRSSPIESAHGSACAEHERDHGMEAACNFSDAAATSVGMQGVLTTSAEQEVVEQAPETAPVSGAAATAAEPNIPPSSEQADAGPMKVMPADLVAKLRI